MSSKSPTFPGGQETKMKNKQSYTVFDPKEVEGYNTFRIPAIVSHNNWIFAFCEGRKDSHLDVGPIDIVLKRGKIKGDCEGIEWDDKLIVVAGSTPEYRSMNTCPVVDKNGNIIVVYSSFPVNKTEKDLIVGDHYDQRVYCRKGTDNGAKWSAPDDITHVLDKWSPLLYAPGPGHSIQMDGGRIIVSGNFQYKRILGPLTKWFSKKLAPFYGSFGCACIIYSDDSGDTWQAGEKVESATYHRCCSFRRCERRVYGNESQVVEISGKRLYINSRTKVPTRNRQSVITDKNGFVKEPAEETKLYEPSSIPRFLSLIIPNCLQCGGCQGSVLSIDSPKDFADCDDKLLIFSNPANKYKRKNLSVRISKDSGGSWSEPLTLYPGPSAYSDLVSVTVTDGDEKKETLIGCMYECAKKEYGEEKCPLEEREKEKCGKDPMKYEASRIVLDLFGVDQLKQCYFNSIKTGQQAEEDLNSQTPLNTFMDEND